MENNPGLEAKSFLSLSSQDREQTPPKTVDIQNEFIVNHAGCYLNLIHSILETEDYESAYNIALMLHELGIKEASFLLSMMYHNGHGVEQDHEKEVDLLEQAASDGYEPALFNLSIALAKGQGVEEDTELAFEIMCNLADNDYEPAIELLEVS